MFSVQLQNILSQHPADVELWLPVYNGHVVTYGLIDRVHVVKYGAVYNDFYGTPGRMDKRVFDNHIDFDEQILLFDSDFGRFRNDKVDIGDDDINYPIKTLNGVGGNPNLVWEVNDFKKVDDVCYERSFYDDSLVSYNTDTEILTIDNNRDNLHFCGKLIGIEDIRNAVNVCKVPFRLRI